MPYYTTWPSHVYIAIHSLCVDTYTKDMKKALAVIVVVLFAVAAGTGWLMYVREHRLARELGSILAAQENLTSFTEKLIPAVFKSATGSTVKFLMPVQNTDARGTFINYQEQTGTFGAAGVIYGVTNPEHRILTLRDIRVGQAIRVGAESDPEHPGQYLINAIYILD